MDSKDPFFWRKWPFGMLKTIQWITPLALIFTLILATTEPFSGIGLVWAVAFIFMVANLVIWVCYLLGLQKATSVSTSSSTVAYRLISFAPVDFIVAVAGTFLFGICSLICVIVFLYTLFHEYNASVPISYLFATAFSLIAGAAHGYYAILMYRNCPNGFSFANLRTMEVDGTKIDNNITIRPTP